MPRIYAKNETHEIDWTPVPFVAGAAAVPKNAEIGYFQANSSAYTIDDSKHKLELWDKMNVDELDELHAYLGGTPSDSDTKHQKVRKIEGALSTALIATVTVTSAAATTGSGKTKLTITNPGTADYYAKTAKTTAPALLYGDVPDATWQKLTLTSGVADEVTPSAATDDKVTVARVNAAGTVDGIGSTNLTLKA